MTNKDFLSQFSGSTKPDSFKEEERIKINKPKKPVNVKLIVIIVTILALIGGLVTFLMLRPTIEVKDFVGLDSSEAKAWIKQNEIETQGIIFREEYNFDYDEGYITSQSIEAGKKVRKDVKMDFTVSLGADPDELVNVPDIESMYKDELQDWVKENKLTKTKIMTAYSDDVEEGGVISYEFKSGADAESFKRSSSLTITVSKGPQPAGTVTVEDFVKQDFSIVEAWGKKNNITIDKVTNYSDKILKDAVISQSIEAKKTIKQGETLTVVVSLGKGVKVPDFTSMDNDDIDDWIKENSSYCKVKEKYSTSSSYVIDQSIKTGNFIGEDSKLTLTLNLGNHFYFDDLEKLIGITVVGESYDRFKDLAENLEDKGLIIDVHKNYEFSDKPKNTILSVNRIYDDYNSYSTAQSLPLEVEIECNISAGRQENKGIEFTYTDFEGESYKYLYDWWTSNGLDVSNLVNDLNINSDDYIKYKVTRIEFYDDGYKDIRLFDGYVLENTHLKAYVKLISE